MWHDKAPKNVDVFNDPVVWLHACVMLLCEKVNLPTITCPHKNLFQKTTAMLIGYWIRKLKF